MKFVCCDRSLTSQRAVDPAVDGKVRALVGGVAAAVVDDSAIIGQSMIAFD